MKQKSDISVFCQNIKRLREVSGLSEEEMAEKLEISTQNLTIIENGELPEDLSSEVLFIIHRRFGVKPKDMFAPRLFDNED